MNETSSSTFKALQAGLSTEGITLYLFWLGIVGMGAGAIYLWMLQGTLSDKYKKVAIVAGIICAVACFHYYRMASIYAESLQMLFQLSMVKSRLVSFRLFPRLIGILIG